MLGEVVGNYRVVAKLAEGGMGAVYRAEHPMLGKHAAVKVLLPELSSNRDIVNRFFNEARAATAVRHPGIVEIFDFGFLPSGMAYITMELLDGEPLSRVLVRRGQLTEHEALLFTRGIASALSAAHEHGIVHRDLKPDNIFLVRDPDMMGGVRPKILDFGIAKMNEAQRVGSTKTKTGAVLGTPTYMSPEQCRGIGEVDARSDLYAVGCILYEMLVGRPPFSSEGMGELMGMHMFAAPTPPSELGVVVSAATEQLVLHLLQKRPEDRVQSAHDLARMLGHGSVPGHLAGSMSGPVSAQMPVMVTPLPMRNTGGAANAPTTLSSATGAAEAPQRSRAGLFAVLGLLVAGGAIAAIVLASGGGDKAATPAVVAPIDAAPVAAIPIDAPEPVVVDAAAPIDAAEPTDAAAEPIDAPRRSNSRRGDKKRDGKTDPGAGSGFDRGD